MNAVDFCNKKIFPQVKMSAMFGMNPRDVLYIVKDIYGGDIVPDDAEAIVDDGFLFLDGRKIGRIAPRLPRPFMGNDDDYDALNYLENRCLSDEA